MPRLDPHSYADSDQIQLSNIVWRATVDFSTRRIRASAELHFVPRANAPRFVDLDTRGLSITGVHAGDALLPYTLDAVDPILGQRLRIELPADSLAIVIDYETAPDASALQWLTPDQTAGGKHPFLFTQCQAIHARSLIPLQDTPRVRVRYRAQLTVPTGLRGLMAARDLGATRQGAQTIERWEMPEPIPPYLIALAVGELASQELGPRSRVWAEPSVVARAATEFVDVDKMLVAAESLFGKYDWERFDLLVMPPSFPYGGMENPRLTFLTPTLLAGDRSLVGVVAHELAHAWTGNLVSGASAEHFWLNEGMTVWAERRIIEALYGRERAELDAALGRRELDVAIHNFVSKPALTKLRTHLSGIDPDETFSVVPYEKGYLFARAIEEAAGRQAFDRFVATYVEAFSFRSITTDDFLALVEKELPGVLARVGADQFVDGEGVPARVPIARSARLDAVVALEDTIVDEQTAERFGPTEWQLYLDQLPRPFAKIAELEKRYALHRSGNDEIRAAFLALALDSALPEAIDWTAEMLGQVGRMKYLKPLYAALLRRDPARARSRFAEVRARYHPIADQVIGGLIA